MSVHLVKGDDPVLRADVRRRAGRRAARRRRPHARGRGAHRARASGSGGGRVAAAPRRREAAVAVARERGAEPAVHDRAPRRRACARSATSPPATSRRWSPCLGDLLDTTDARVRRRRRHGSRRRSTKALKDAEGRRSTAPRDREAEDVLDATLGRGRGSRCGPTPREAVADAPRRGRRPGRRARRGARRRRTAPARRSTSTTSRRTSARPGAVPPYELTNAIEEGDVAGALEVLHRLLTATEPAAAQADAPAAGARRCCTATTGGSLRLDDPERAQRRRRGRRARRRR